MKTRQTRGARNGRGELGRKVLFLYIPRNEMYSIKEQRKGGKYSINLAEGLKARKLWRTVNSGWRRFDGRERND